MKRARRCSRKSISSSSSSFAFPDPVNRRRPRFLLRSGIAVLALLPTAVFAAEFPLGEAVLDVGGALTLGTMLRTQARDAALLPNANSSLIGVAGTAPGGRNQDDGNLNFAKGDAVSTVLKGYVDVRARHRDLAVFTRIKVWHDLVLADEGMPWGHATNGYAAGQPLGESGFPRRARFSGAAIEDAYVDGRFEVAGAPLRVTLGRQTLPWGGGFLIGGGVADLNPTDAPAMRRPGALAEERLVAFPAVHARLDLSPAVAAEFFSQFRFEPNVVVPCGTFYSTADFVAPGCDRIWVTGANDRDTTGFRNRAATPEVADGGQFGMSVSYRVPSLATVFGATVAQYHSRAPFGSMVKAALPANAQYLFEYPERIRLFALDFTTRLPGATIRGELTHRPNQPIQLNGLDLLAAFATPAPNPALLRTDSNATPTGATYHGYDRKPVTQLQLAANTRRSGLLGAESATFGAEVGVKRVSGLPDVSTRRYGRSDVFGSGPVPGFACTGSDVTCTSRGFVTARSWGYRLRFELSYPGAIDGVELKPGILYGHDVRGWSPDGVFNEGRKAATVSLRGEFGPRHFAEFAWQQAWGGVYDNARDRDAATLVVGLRF